MGSSPLLARKASGPLRRAPNLPPPIHRGHGGMKSRDGASPGGPCSPGHPRPRHVSPGGVPHPAAWQQAPSAARPSGAALLLQIGPSRRGPAPGTAQGLPRKRENDGLGPAAAASTYPAARRHVEGASDEGTETVARWRPGRKARQSAGAPTSARRCGLERREAAAPGGHVEFGRFRVPRDRPCCGWVRSPPPGACCPRVPASGRRAPLGAG